jgi:hypothetical protein
VTAEPIEWYPDRLLSELREPRAREACWMSQSTGLPGYATEAVSPNGPGKTRSRLVAGDGPMLAEQNGQPMAAPE